MRRTETLHIGDVLNEFFSRPYVAAKVAEGRLPDTWREVVGERVASLTSSLRLENHVLYAHITSSVVRAELFNRREALAAEINRVSGVRLVNVVMNELAMWILYLCRQSISAFCVGFCDVYTVGNYHACNAFALASYSSGYALFSCRNTQYACAYHKD